MAIKIDHGLAWAAATDTANRAMRKAGRTVWSIEDYALAASVYSRLMGLEIPETGPISGKTGETQ